MATWDPPSDAELDVDKPIKAVDIRRIRDLSEAMAEGAAGAPIAGGLIPISSIDLAGEATADFTGFNATKFDSYIFKLANVIPATDNVTLICRTSTDGGASYDAGAGNYKWALDGNDTNGASTVAESATDTSITLAQNVGSGAGEDGVSGNIEIFGPHIIKRTGLVFSLASVNLSGFLDRLNGVGHRTSAADVDAFRILCSSGNLESGVISMYGVVG